MHAAETNGVKDNCGRCEHNEGKKVIRDLVGSKHENLGYN